MRSSSRHRATRRRSPPERFADVGVAGRQAQRVHGDLERAVEVPGVRWRRSGPAASPARRAARRSRRRGRPSPRRPRRSGRGARLVSATPVLDVAQHVLGRVELRLLREVTRRVNPAPSRASPRVRRRRSPAMISSSVDLPAPFAPEHADLGARVHRDVDALEDLAVGRDELLQVPHRDDELGLVELRLGHVGRRGYAEVIGVPRSRASGRTRPSPWATGPGRPVCRGSGSRACPAVPAFDPIAVRARLVLAPPELDEVVRHRVVACRGTRRRPPWSGRRSGTGTSSAGGRAAKVSGVRFGPAIWMPEREEEQAR